MPDSARLSTAPFGAGSKPVSRLPSGLMRARWAICPIGDPMPVTRRRRTLGRCCASALDLPADLRPPVRPRSGPGVELREDISRHVDGRRRRPRPPRSWSCPGGRASSRSPRAWSGRARRPVAAPTAERRERAAGVEHRAGRLEREHRGVGLRVEPRERVPCSRPPPRGTGRPRLRAAADVDRRAGDREREDLVLGGAGPRLDRAGDGVAPHRCIAGRGTGHRYRRSWARRRAR